MGYSCQRAVFPRSLGSKRPRHGAARTRFRFTGATPQRGHPAGILLQHAASGPQDLPHGRGVRRSWRGTALFPAGGWKARFIPTWQKAILQLFQPGCIGMTLNSARGQRELYEWFFDRSCSCGSGFDVDVALTAATRLPDKITFSVQVC